MPHSSWFSYKLQRKYPYRWFTPVAIVGGVIFTILFSFINLAANGYQLKTIYVTDPNATLSQRYWYNNPPWSWTSKIETTCEAQNLQTGSQFFTSHLGLTYTLKSIWTGSSADNVTTNFPALAYLNNPLEDCHVDLVDVEMRRSSRDNGAPAPWWVWEASYADATAHCTIATDTGFVNASFTVHYTDLQRTYDYVLETDYVKSASIWWGTRLVNVYWQGCLWAMSATNWTDEETPSSFTSNTNSKQWDLGSFKLSVVNESSIQSMDMFSLEYYLVAEDGTINNPRPEPANFSQATWYNNASLPLSAIMTEAQGFAKAFYSLILVDLGQASLSNLLLDEDNLQSALQAKQDSFRQGTNPWLPQYDSLRCWFTEAEAAQVAVTDTVDCNEFNRLIDPNITNYNTDAVMEKYRLDAAYELFNDQMGPLNTSTATIYSQYACSVPVQRSAGPLAIAIIIADLVLLSTVWTIYNFIVGWRLRRDDPIADACPRCLELGDALPLSPPSKGMSGSGGRSVTLSRSVSGESSVALLRPEKSVALLRP